MRSKWGLSILALLIAITGRSAAAQELPWWTTCTPDYLPIMQDGTSAPDFTAACNSFLTCLENADAGICQMRLAVSLIETCEEADRVCQTQAMLIAAGVAPGYFDGFLPTPEMPEIVDMINLGFQMIDAGQYESAADVYASHEGSDLNPMLRLSRALAERLAGNSSAALSDIDAALITVPDSPLLVYARILTLADMEDVTGTGYALYHLSRILEGDAELAPFVSSLMERYPVNLSHAENWLMYPVYFLSFTPAGSAYLDQHHADPVPVRLIFDTPLSITMLDLTVFDYPVSVARFPPDGNGASFSSGDMSGTITLTPHSDDLLMFGANAAGFEVRLIEMALLAPEGAPDPRLLFTGIRCDFLFTFEPGSTVIDIGWMGNGTEPTIDLYAEPDPSAAMTVVPGGAALMEETVCAHDALWWQVWAGADLTGWVRVNDGSRLLITPLESLPMLPPLP